MFFSTYNDHVPLGYVVAISTSIQLILRSNIQELQITINSFASIIVYLTNKNQRISSQLQVDLLNISPCYTNCLWETRKTVRFRCPLMSLSYEAKQTVIIYHMQCLEKLFAAIPRINVLFLSLPRKKCKIKLCF